MLRIAPITVKSAQEKVYDFHRHLKKVQGGLFAAALMVGDDTVGVAIAANPARVWQGTGRFVIARVAVLEGHRNGCSMLYGALCRAGAALGYREAWTYTLPGEPGTSLRAAGFKFMGMTKGGEHDRPSRQRGPALRPEPKQRWVRHLTTVTASSTQEKS